MGQYRLHRAHRGRHHAPTQGIMAERADAFLALPGGIGTFEELFEIWTLKQLGYIDKPIGLLSVNGYYDKLVEFMAESTNEGFVSDWQMEMLRVEAETEPLLQHLLETSGKGTRQTVLTSRA